MQKSLEIFHDFAIKELFRGLDVGTSPGQGGWAGANGYLVNVSGALVLAAFCDPAAAIRWVLPALLVLLCSCTKGLMCFPQLRVVIQQKRCRA